MVVKYQMVSKINLDTRTTNLRDYTCYFCPKHPEEFKGIQDATHHHTLSHGKRFQVIFHLREGGKAFFLYKGYSM